MTYVLGDTDAEHLRLVRQARLLAPFAERLFRDAGIVAGMRVLDLGCGMGDVSMLVAQLVGPSGSVVGVDRENAVLEKARQRAKLLVSRIYRLLNPMWRLWLTASDSMRWSGGSFSCFFLTQSRC
jgi:tRNA A58 N-methylase Trm61